MFLLVFNPFIPDLFEALIILYMPYVDMDRILRQR